MRVACYVRLSEDTPTTTSPARQREVCAAYATTRGWELTATFEDIDVSATHKGLDRPALTDLRAAVARGEVDVVIAWRLDRLARTVLDTLTLLKEWERGGCATASATEGIDLTTPAGRAMATLIAVFAEMEAAAISERSAMSVDRLRRDHRWAGGVVPYGYVPAPNPAGPGRVLTVDPAEAAVVREAADRVLAGTSLYAVCRDLNAREVPAPRSERRKVARMSPGALSEYQAFKPEHAGITADTADRGQWTSVTMGRLLTAEHLLGRQTHRGTLLLDPSTGLPAQVWEPILDRVRARQMREVLGRQDDAAGQAPRPVRRRAARLLSGLVLCAECGARMLVRDPGSTGPQVYGCPTRSHGGGCTSPRISAPRMEALVTASWHEAFGNLPQTVTVPAGAVAPSSGVTYAEVEAALRETATAMTADGADVVALAERLATLKATRAQVRNAAERRSRFAVVRPTGRSLAEVWEAADTNGRRTLLAEHLQRLTVGPASLRGGRFDPSRVSLAWISDEATDAHLESLTTGTPCVVCGIVHTTAD